jgi:serpin B
LVNAIYFKGKWKSPFSKDSTKSENFHTSASNIIKAKFMHNTGHYRYYEDATLQAVEIPYMGGRTAMVILLPKEKDGISQMENKLGHLYYSKIISSMNSPKVIVAFPKFKTTTAFELGGTLSAMGMPDAFSSSADFSGISNEGLHISNVIHKAFIDVNEEGTEAAAATAVIMPFSIAQPMATAIFNANHPFIFVIRDTMTGGILFMGKITDPTKE